ncbi:hypothetical protein [Natrinema halophilum]|uniref:Uncharacterized protein n=1 Tax=Natrinema halophilum TaxID=1699371 RepID=A0A7D5KQM1_9EURY|nr:hypothetical protein [Natrinema halophilum]QLG47564.1 hypothetical protein HYG82_01225 [Natrinema halophilum]
MNSNERENRTTDCNGADVRHQWKAAPSPPTNAIAIESAPGYGLGFEPVAEREIGSRNPAAQSPQRIDESVLVAVQNYRAGMRFRVVGQLPRLLTIRLLRLPTGETTSVLTRPDEYRGYVTRSVADGRVVDASTLVFTRGVLESGVEYEFEADAQMFSNQLNLFQSSVQRVGSESDTP